MMELREALEVLGPIRVRMGMRAIDDRRCAEGWEEIGACATCFVGEAFGGTNEGYQGAMCIPAGRDGMYRQPVIREAAVCLESWYEGWPEDVDMPLHFGMVELRATLRAECVLFLAEHGTAVEPTVEHAHA